MKMTASSESPEAQRQVAPILANEQLTALQKIQALEALITPRRMRETVFGSASSGAFVAVVNNAINDVREQR